MSEKQKQLLIRAKPFIEQAWQQAMEANIKYMTFVHDHCSSNNEHLIIAQECADIIAGIDEVLKS